MAVLLKALVVREIRVEPSLVVIGISYRTATLAVRERFWMDEAERVKALTTLIRSEGVDECVVFSSCNRTEFYLWTQNAAEGANSVLRFLTRSYNLKLSDWSNFYRLMGEPALTHIMRVAAALDTQVYGEAEVIPSLTAAWYLAQKAGTTGCFLDGILGHALEFAAGLAERIEGHNCIVSVARAAVEQSRESFADLSKRQVLVLGAGKLARSIVREMRIAGVTQIRWANRTSKRLLTAAEEDNVSTLPWEERWKAAADADVLVVATGARKAIVTTGDLAAAMRNRGERPLAVLDLGVPRNVDAAVRAMDAVYLFDVDDFSENVMARKPLSRSLAEAEQSVRLEAAHFHRKLMSERVVPTITALRERLQEICDQELNSLADQFGPFTEDQSQAMRAYATHIAQRISATIARQLNPGSGDTRDERLADSLSRMLTDRRETDLIGSQVAK